MSTTTVRLATPPQIIYNQTMLDIKYIRENPDAVQTAAKNKGYAVNIAELLESDKTRRDLQGETDALREKRNAISAQMKGGKPSPELIEQGKLIKDELSHIENRLREADENFAKIMMGIPNVMADDVPIGGEELSVEIRTWGERKSGAIDHVDFCEKRDWLDFERGAKVAGAKFYYLKNELALLENAIYQFALGKLIAKNFTFMTVPHMVNQRTAEGAGFAPKSDKESNEYFIDGENMMLVGTAEAPLTGYHADEILDEDDLPLFYAGYSPCYRREAGTYGKHTRGLFRVHQFNKLEMYAFCLPEQSADIHEKILAIEEEIWQELEIPYHVINIASGDLGAPAAKKYDIEYWSPVDAKYRELTSCSNCTDYQARNLNIRVRRKNGAIETVHTLNGTAVALARSLVAIIENYQLPDGRLRVPIALQSFMNEMEIL